MKQTFKKPSYYLLSQAMDGDEKAIEKILAFYDPYISKCCLRPLYDEYGNVYIVVDMELKGLIREALIKMIFLMFLLGFKLDIRHESKIFMMYCYLHALQFLIPHIFTIL